METETTTAPAAPAGGSALPALGAEQREALMRYAAQLLEEAASYAGEVVEAALRQAGGMAVGASSSATAGDVDAGEAGEDHTIEKQFAAVRRHALMRLRREGVAQRTTTADGDDGAASLAQRVERLTPKQREAVWLKFSHGFGYEGVARITGLSLRNVSFLLHSALTNLREAGAPEGQVPVPDDSRLTDYALGEMKAAERESFDAELRHDSDLKAAMAEVRATARELHSAIGQYAGATRRAAKKKRRAGAGFWRTKWFYVGLAAALGLAIAVTWWARRRPTEVAASVARDAEDFRLRPDSWKLAQTRADRESSDPRSGGQGGAGERPVRAPALKTRADDRSSHAKAPDDDPRIFPLGAEGGASGAGPSNAAAVMAGGGAGVLSAPASTVDTSSTAHDGVDTKQPTTNGGKASGNFSELTSEAQKSKAQPSTAKRAAPSATQAASAQASPKSREPRPAASLTQGRQDRDAAPANTQVKAAPDAPAAKSARSAATSALRANLAAKHLPAPATVDLREMLEDFAPAPTVPVDAPELVVATEVAEAPWAPERRLVKVVVTAAKPPAARHATANLTLLIDVSASMDAPDRLPLVGEAARRLLRDLQPEDRVGIVTYAGEARLVLPSTPVFRAAEIRAALAALRPEGMTNGSAGLRRAYALAHEGFLSDGVNRVVLCTDGDFNMGVTSEAELSALVQREAKGGVALAVFGFGRGRQFDPRLEALAVQGGGGSGNVNTRRDAQRRMASEVNGWHPPVARGVQVQFDCDPAHIAACRLIGYEETFLPPETAGRRRVEASELAPGESITALFEVEPASSAPKAAKKSVEGLALRLTYTATDGQPATVQQPVVDSGLQFADASADFRYTAAIAALGLALRASPPSAQRLTEVVTWAEAAAADLADRDPAGYTAEFLTLAREARELAGSGPLR